MIYRNIAPRLLEALRESPVTLLIGARQTGKSTLAKWIVQEHHKARYITLDDASMLAAARNDPTGFIQGFDENLVIDEVQRAPELFIAIKSEVEPEKGTREIPSNRVSQRSLSPKGCRIACRKDGDCKTISLL